MLSVVMLSVVLLSVVMLSVIMLSVVLLSVVMLSVGAPLRHPIQNVFLEQKNLQRFKQGKLKGEVSLYH